MGNKRTIAWASGHARTAYDLPDRPAKRHVINLGSHIQFITSPNIEKEFLDEGESARHGCSHVASSCLGASGFMHISAGEAALPASYAVYDTANVSVFDAQTALQARV